MDLVVDFTYAARDGRLSKALVQRIDGRVKLWKPDFVDEQVDFDKGYDAPVEETEETQDYRYNASYRKEEVRSTSLDAMIAYIAKADSSDIFQKARDIKIGDVNAPELLFTKKEREEFDRQDSKSLPAMTHGMTRDDGKPYAPTVRDVLRGAYNIHRFYPLLRNVPLSTHNVTVYYDIFQDTFRWAISIECISHAKEVFRSIHLDHFATLATDGPMTQFFVKFREFESILIGMGIATGTEKRSRLTPLPSTSANTWG
ncbi:hypothetical protein CC86DRAFT_454129 [Ophiobolus disseminans]|uniref:Uncharacterized protein n=1 Tax=Ophiobolus disseminans TaxID=1469910 RepID=A0A6A7AA58_9PLEO|nr:hypothetical protein CC86DRAFT_454129 [Ophiobolus disseminans]